MVELGLYEQGPHRETAGPEGPKSVLAEVQRSFQGHI